MEWNYSSKPVIPILPYHLGKNCCWHISYNYIICRDRDILLLFTFCRTYQLIRLRPGTPFVRVNRLEVEDWLRQQAALSESTKPLRKLRQRAPRKTVPEFSESENDEDDEYVEPDHHSSQRRRRRRPGPRRYRERISTASSASKPFACTFRGSTDPAVWGCRVYMLWVIILSYIKGSGSTVTSVLFGVKAKTAFRHTMQGALCECLNPASKSRRRWVRWWRRSLQIQWKVLVGNQKKIHWASQKPWCQFPNWRCWSTVRWSQMMTMAWRRPIHLKELTWKYWQKKSAM